MKMLKNKKILLAIGIILAFFSVAVWATSASVSWTPVRYAPWSIIPGQSTTTIVTFTNNGPSTINGKKLLLEVRGNVASVVSVTQPNFPTTVKKGESVSVNLSVQTSNDMPIGVVDGTLALLETKPNGTIKDVFKTALPIEITVSPFLLPPDPGEEGEATIEGVDIGGGPNGEPNGVRDDIDRYIVFTYPNSEKVREALKQEARGLNLFMRDREDKAKTWENYETTVSKGYPCLVHSVGEDSLEKDTSVARSVSGKFEVQFLNTADRSRAYNKAFHQMGGYVGVPISGDRWEAHYKDSCSFNPDSLPN